MPWRVLFLAFFTMSLATSAAADNPNGWRLIGKVEANHKADHDTIHVNGPNDDFRKIKLKVSGADLNIQRLVVTHDNGQPDNIDVREKIPQGGKPERLT